ncbi:hypothetical protein ACE1TI_11180 [Alteribacillus sp. JSM 102045]|uniref:hypothetical protein n=1 Tax=Alteribacillus sp. JSM 102045 TaxID=1562101 RepID=UPI0035BEDB0D
MDRENREWKKLLERLWNNELDEKTFLKEIKNLRLNYLKKQKAKGIQSIPVGEFTFIR